MPGRDSGNADSTRTLSGYLGTQFPEPDWVIDGLMARGERLILTGEEGLGKSTLQRQIAMCSAAGIEPFNGQSIEPRTVLLIDAENPDFILKKRLAEMRVRDPHGTDTRSKRAGSGSTGARKV